MIKALRQLRNSLPRGADADQFLPVIAATLRSTTADLELQRVELLGPIATAIFERIASTDGFAKGLFTTAAAVHYSGQVGRTVRVEDIQRVVNELVADNLIMRRGHGMYCITDPFVQPMWRERKGL